MADGSPLPFSPCGQTNTCEDIAFSHTADVVGNENGQ